MTYLTKLQLPHSYGSIETYLTAATIEKAKTQAIHMANKLAIDICNDPLANITITLKQTAENPSSATLF